MHFLRCVNITISKEAHILINRASCNKNWLTYILTYSGAKSNSPRSMKLEGQRFYESVESGYGALLRGVTHFGQYGLVEIKQYLVIAV
jgi:hypothetical protein